MASNVRDVRDVENKNKPFVPTTMSIEEYRKLELTPEQEWNNVYNPKRCSLEAIETIEIKKRGKGSIKPEYSSNSKEEGPFYDPECIHVHVWKSSKLIKNFKGEQFQNVPYIQFTDLKPGFYCCICHARRIPFEFKWIENLSENYDRPDVRDKETDFWYHSSIMYTGGYYDKKNEHMKRNFKRWKNIINKVLYSLYNKKIIYQVSKHKSLYLWPWQLTPYQKFRLIHPDYKSNNIFIKSESVRFSDNFSIMI